MWISITFGLLTIAISAAQPTPPTWPQAFRIDFIVGLNRTAWPNAPNRISPGTLYYDWGQRAQLIAHQAYSYECQHFYNITAGCSLLFSPNGLFAKFPAWGTCCLDLPGVGSVPPDWVVTNNYTFQGTEMILGALCRKWSSPDPTVPHNYWDTVALSPDGYNVPARFSFPNPIQDFYYDVPSFRVGPQDPSWFVVPPTCARRCKGGRGN